MNDGHLHELEPTARGVHRQLPTYGVGGGGASRWLIQISFHEFNFAINLVWHEIFGILE